MMRTWLNTVRTAFFSSRRQISEITLPREPLSQYPIRVTSDELTEAVKECNKRQEYHPYPEEISKRFPNRVDMDDVEKVLAEQTATAQNFSAY
jgi:hypothetical protein